MRKLAFFFLFSVLLLVFSCKPQVPGKYIQPDELEDILYDWHLADAMASVKEDADSSQYDLALYRQAVLRKHGISQAEFDSSLVYYTRHADRLHKIYENLSKRLSDEALALGASTNDISRYGDMTSARDTSNLWTGMPACVLTSAAPYNVMTFNIDADSTYHRGDKIILSFNCDFIYKSGMRNGVALLAVQFKNDSVASSVTHLSSNMDYSVTVSDDNGKGIKSVRGFFYLSGSNSEEAKPDLRLLFIDKIRMVRMRAKPIQISVNDDDGDVNKSDTAKKQNPADSMPVKSNMNAAQSAKRVLPPNNKAAQMPVRNFGNPVKVVK